jgi:Ran GTPase-activating protein (RanGAP) involved in mRNA processing and transport
VQEKVFRMMIKGYCESIPELKKALESRLLVRGKDIVRYHDGAESEAEGDDANEKDSDEEASGDEDNESGKESREEIGHSDRKPIAIPDEQLVPRFTKCLNCKEIFDLADNERGYCTWHTGMAIQLRKLV